NEPVTGRCNIELAIEMRRTLSMLAALVQAAQRTGDLRDGDPDAIAALIVGPTLGQADLEPSDMSSGVGAAPLMLLDLLAWNRGDADPKGACGDGREELRAPWRI